MKKMIDAAALPPLQYKQLLLHLADSSCVRNAVRSMRYGRGCTFNCTRWWRHLQLGGLARLRARLLCSPPRVLCSA